MRAMDESKEAMWQLRYKIRMAEGYLDSIKDQEEYSRPNAMEVHRRITEVYQASEHFLKILSSKNN